MIENRLKLIAEQLILLGVSEVVLRVEESTKTALSEEVIKNYVVVRGTTPINNVLFDVASYEVGGVRFHLLC